VRPHAPAAHMPKRARAHEGASGSSSWTARVQEEEPLAPSCILEDRRLHADLREIYLHLKAPRFDLQSDAEKPARRLSESNRPPARRSESVRPPAQTRRSAQMLGIGQLFISSQRPGSAAASQGHRLTRIRPREAVFRSPSAVRPHGTSNDTELEKLKKRLQFVVNCIDCFVS
jgi:hypothetical protein